MSDSKHTPTPWREGIPDDNDAAPLLGANGEPIAYCIGDDDIALILRCVNSHASLLAACKAVLRSDTTMPLGVLRQLEAAIAEAE